MLLNGLSPFSIVFGSIGVVISIVEYRQWQRRERVSSGSREGRYVFPRWAWFGVGAVPSVLVVGIAYGIVLGISGRTVVTPSSLVWFLEIVVWIAGGLASERLLVRAAERREEAERATAPPLPPPPPGPPPATNHSSAEKHRRPRGEVPSRPSPDRGQDPRGRF